MHSTYLSVFLAIFHKYCCYIKHGGILTNLNLWSPWRVLLICESATVRVCDAWIRIYYVLCSKHIAPLAVWSGRTLVRDGPLGAPVFVRLAYFEINIDHLKRPLTRHLLFHILIQREVTAGGCYPILIDDGTLTALTAPRMAGSK